MPLRMPKSLRHLSIVVAFVVRIMTAGFKPAQGRIMKCRNYNAEVYFIVTAFPRITALVHSSTVYL